MNFSNKISTMRYVLIGGILLLILKFLAYFLTNSNGILTDAVESIVNVLAGAFALYCLYYASKPADEDHPYGHGKIEFFSSGVEGGMILIAGITMISKAGYNFFYPAELEKINIGAILVLFSGAVNYFMAKILIKKGSAQNSATMIAEGTHLLTDTWSSLGLLLGLVIIYFTQLNWLDNLIGILLGIFICATGFKLIRESVFNLLDKVDYSKVKHLLEILNQKRKATWIDIHNFRVLKYGSVIHVDCHVTLPWYFNLEETQKEMDELRKSISQELEHEIEFFIHPDPCHPTSCAVCEISYCKVRKKQFVKKIDWTLENILPDTEHTALEA